MSHLLVVEDEAHLANGLRFNLEAEGHSVEVAADGESAIEQLLKSGKKFDAVVLDVMLPGTDGFEVATELRKAKNYVPVLMLTARGRPEDVLQGFAAGADDYLPKPFELSILLVRIRSLIRRTAWQSPETPPPPTLSSRTLSERSESKGEGPASAFASSPAPTQSPDTYSFNHRTIHFDRLELIAPNRTTHLTLMEADLLRYLTDRAGQIIPRKAILEEVWRVHADTDTRAVDNFIVRLRRYIEDDPANPTHLTTVRGIGYRFLPNP